MREETNDFIIWSGRACELSRTLLARADFLDAVTWAALAKSRKAIGESKAVLASTRAVAQLQSRGREDFQDQTTSLWGRQGIERSG